MKLYKKNASLKTSPREKLEMQIKNAWLLDGVLVVEECRKAREFLLPEEDGVFDFDEFLEEVCIDRGNISGTLLSGIEAIAPEVHKVIPERMGNDFAGCEALVNLEAVLELLGMYPSVAEECEPYEQWDEDLLNINQ